MPPTPRFSSHCQAVLSPVTLSPERANFLDCLPDRTWVKKKTTKTTVRPPPQAPLTRSFEGTSLDEKSGLVDSGYRDETSHEILDEATVESSLHAEQLESSLPDVEEPWRTEREARESTFEMIPEIIRDHTSRRGRIHRGRMR